MTLSRRSLLTGLLAAPLGLNLGLPARAADWELLGTSNVNLKKNVTILRVGAREGVFRRLRLDVAEERVVIEGLEVTYSNGETVALDLRATIRAGGQSRPIDLPEGFVHAIRTIRMQHKRIPTGGTAVISVYGR